MPSAQPAVRMSEGGIGAGGGVAAALPNTIPDPAGNSGGGGGKATRAWATTHVPQQAQSAANVPRHAFISPPLGVYVEARAERGLLA